MTPAKDQSPERAVTLVPHDPNWPTRFAQEHDRLTSNLGVGVVIEHVGSTAIARMEAKPIIDVLVGHHGDEAGCLDRLVKLGYIEEGAREGHRWLCWPAPGRRAFIVHLVQYGGDVWVARLTFRDRLRQSAPLRAAYALLKRDLAAKHAGDLGAYTAGKAAFVREVVAGKHVHPF